MKRVLFSSLAFAAGMGVILSSAVSQPPEGREGKEAKGKDGPPPPRFELGQVFPPPLLDELKLTQSQEKELETIRKDLKVKLDKLLTDDQKKAVEEFRPRGPGGPRGEGDRGGPKRDGDKGPPKGEGDKGGPKREGDKGPPGAKKGGDRPGPKPEEK